MQLRITAYAISRTFNMMSHPRQPWLATHCRWLLFHPAIDIPRCLWDRIQGPEGPDNRYTGLSGAKRSWLPYHRDTWIAATNLTGPFIKTVTTCLTKVLSGEENECLRAVMLLQVMFRLHSETLLTI